MAGCTLLPPSSPGTTIYMSRLGGSLQLPLFFQRGNSSWTSGSLELPVVPHSYRLNPIHHQLLAHRNCRLALLRYAGWSNVSVYVTLTPMIRSCSSFELIISTNVLVTFSHMVVPSSMTRTTLSCVICLPISNCSLIRCVCQRGQSNMTCSAVSASPQCIPRSPSA